MTNHDSTNLGTEKIGKLIFRLAIPSVIAQIINMLYNIVDRVYIGHIPETGAPALTGLGLCAPVLYIIAAFAALVFAGSSARAAISMGKKDTEGAEKILGNSFAFLVLISVLVTIIVEVFARPLLFLFGASEVTVPYALSYMQIYALGTIFVSITLGMNAFITAQGFAKISMLTVIVGAICNIILDPIFIFGFGWGVRGAAFATILSQAVSTVWVLFFLTGKRTVLKLRLSNLRIDWRLMGPCLALGLSPFIMQSTEGILSVCFNSSLQKYGGDLAVGAMTILATVNQCIFLVVSGFTQGALPIISYNYGAGNPKRVKEAFKLLLLVCVGYTMVMWAAIMLFPGRIAGILTSDVELRSYAAWAMRIYGAMFGIFGIQTACQQTFIGIGNAKTSLFLALLRKIILLIPLIYILPHFFADQTMAVYLAEPVADTIAVTTTGILFFIQFRKALS